MAGLADTLAQSVHQIDDVVRLFHRCRFFDGMVLGLAAHQFLQRVLVFVLEFPGIEFSFLGGEDMSGEFTMSLVTFGEGTSEK